MVLRSLILATGLLVAACAADAGVATGPAPVTTTTVLATTTPTPVGTTTEPATTVVTTAAPSTSLPAGSKTADVTIKSFSFTPSEMTLRVGDTLRWTVTSGTHTTTSTDGVWDSKNLTTGSVFSFTFTAPGTYNYFCAIHPGMQAKIVVEG